MAEITLVAQPRLEQGSAASRRLRRAGRVPAVLYGHGADPRALSVDARDLRTALSTESGLNALLDLDLAGTSYLAIAREVQRDPLRHTVAHVDFQVVRRDEIVSADVPLVLLGEALGVSRAGGTVEHVLVNLTIKAKPADIPSSIELDISELSVGDAIRVADLPLPAGVVTETDPETAVVVAVPPRVATEETVEEVAEGAAGEASSEA
ncbi:MAG: ribosomal protein Ctc-form [Acidimicrobiaceae bacterium]|nr:ribosomal protein Ctc-form [Acidimicrobiaceae bacterium]